MIHVQDFAKTFHIGLRRRPFEAARSINLDVGEREIFGFLGPNGAGKTTTIKALLGLIRPDHGTLKICGADPTDMSWRTKVGYMSEHPTFYDFLSGHEMVSWFGQLAGMGRHEADTAAKKILARVGLEAAMTRRLRGYSKGMLQRAGLAQALVGSPPLLILDEPMSGLDPIGRKEIRELIVSLREEGKTIFFSTHILPDVEMTCDRVSIIHKGRTLRSGRLSEIIEETTRGVLVVVKSLSDEAAGRLEKDHPTLAAMDGAHRIEFKTADEATAFVRQATEAGGQLVRLEPHRDDLEQIFVRSLGPEVEPS